MGFDNECIVNIQSLPGEYFCPVCRNLISPNEALQSLCTHLYCKPCLTYVASTTRACPYDGYLVTESDSKPLIESNKTLAETIGKVAVLCLYHKSGCAWQGSFSDSTSHCSGCAFGNSPVVCNRCGLQMVHRQTQEHVQNCPGVNAQAQQAASSQDPSAASNATSTDKSRNVSQAAAIVSQAATAVSSGQDSKQPAILNSQNQAANQSIVQPTTEHWYQQQQQYQQFYQQYSGYDPYQQQYQHYYPYQQPVVPQYQQHQMQAQPHAYIQNQPQTLPQSQTQGHLQPQNLAQPQPQTQTGQTQQHSYGQAPLTAPSHNQAQPQSAMQVMTSVQSRNQTQTQMQLQSQPPSHLYPPSQAHAQGPQPQPQPQPHVQIPQCQQPQFQNPTPQQSQSYPVSQPQSLSQMPPHAPMQHFSVSQFNQPPTPNAPPQTLPASVNAVTGHQSFPQSKHHAQMHQMGPQVPSQTHPQAVSQSISQHPVQMQSQLPQQGPLVRQNQSHTLYPNQLQPASLPSGHGPPLQPTLLHHAQQPTSAQQRPGVQSQQPVVQLFLQQQLPMPSQLRPQTPLQSSLQYTNSYPQLPAKPVLSHNVQQNQPQSSLGKQILPHASITQSYIQSNTDGAVGSLNPVQQLSGNKDNLVSSSRQMQLSATETSRGLGWIDKPGEFNQHQAGSWKVLGKDGNLDAAPGLADTVPKNPVRNEFDQKQATGENKQSGEGEYGKEINRSLQATVKDTMSNVVENRDPANSKHLGKGGAAGSALQPAENDKYCNSDKKIECSPPMKKSNGVETRTPDVPSVTLPKDETGVLGPAAGASHGPFPLADQSKHRSIVIQSGFMSMPNEPAPHSGFASHSLAPGLDPTQFRNQGPGPTLQPGRGGTEHFLPSTIKQPQHPEMPSGVFPPTGSLASYGRETTYNVTKMGLNDQTQGSGFHPTGPKSPHGESIQRPHAGVVANLPGQHHPSMDSDLFPNEGSGYNNGPAGFPERMNLFPAPHNIDFENNMKKLPRPSHFDCELVSRFGSYPSGPPERGPHALHHDGGLKLNLGVPNTAFRMYPPHLSNEPGERPIGFNGENEGKLDAIHGPPDYLGPSPGYGPYLADRFTPRGRVGEYPGMSARMLGFHGGLAGKSGYDDFGSRHSRRLVDQVFHDSSFPALPSHSRKGEFDNAGNLRLNEHVRGGDFIGNDGISGHVMRGEHMVPHNRPWNLQFGDRLGPENLEYVGRRNEPGYPRFGEPGFRSRFSLHGFPNDGSSFAGGDESLFESFKKRKPASMGWCRICNVDCETVEGLDNHSQTRAHQKVAMHIVKNIKKNAKKRKLASSEAASADNLSKLRKTGFESLGNEN